MYAHMYVSRPLVCRRSKTDGIASSREAEKQGKVRRDEKKKWDAF